MESAIAALPALVSRNKDKRTRARVPATINRDIVPLRASLSKLLAPGAPNSNAAWQEALKPIKNADRQRTRYPDISQRRELLAMVEQEAAPFVKALCLAAASELWPRRRRKRSISRACRWKRICRSHIIGTARCHLFVGRDEARAKSRRLFS
jgi:hypothetical protein